ncbi:hypothetical protein CPB85DRAFT_470262 [Mucidula mucida]|nr:hypothetical protein CPB85DRAFT_470262 [Mucidula mucida]
MGGSAFLTGNFPRLSPALYHSFKDRHTAVLKTLYTLVATPIEAPEKVDHGDVDFIVWKESDLPSHDTVKTALGATMVNPMDGPRTSNYAVALPGDDNYYQVDVHVCAAEEEFHRTMFFHSYGDMGMILGLIARGVGLHLGVHGLRYPQPPHPAWHLSSKFDEILPFLGWDICRYEKGFTTRAELYQWLSSSPYIRPEMFTSANSVGKVKPDRKMYYDFVEWAQKQNMLPASTTSLKEAALDHYGKKEEVEAFLRGKTAQARYKAAFNGKLVAEWADVGQDWRSVKNIMDRVRSECGGDEGLSRLVEEKGDEVTPILINLVRTAKVDCGIGQQ